MYPSISNIVHWCAIVVKNVADYRMHTFIYNFKVSFTSNKTCISIDHTYCETYSYLFADHEIISTYCLTSNAFLIGQTLFYWIYHSYNISSRRLIKQYNNIKALQHEGIWSVILNLQIQEESKCIHINYTTNDSVNNNTYALHVKLQCTLTCSVII